jgi:uncharacterized protein YhjY with autotransporter beta-barrel domain
MSRPHEPHADALRIARQIVDEAGSRLAKAVQQDEPQAIADACHNLTVSIAQAIVDADRAAAEQAQGEDNAMDSTAELNSGWRSWPATLFGVPALASLAVKPAKGGDR